MRAIMLLTVVVALLGVSIHTSAAADPECIYRQIRNMPMHWANPTDCGRFYRCTNKNVKREITCAADKEYNMKTGKCASAGKGYCKLQLAAPLIGDDNICANEVTGAYIAQTGFCRDFYICNDKDAYQQNCDAGSFFNSTSAVCEPDTDNECWQNYCLQQDDGTYMADATACRSFYVCTAADAVSQSCDSGSFFNATAKNCQPDVNNENCWENYCLNANDGDLVKDPNNCHAYYKCSDKQATAETCADGSYFDWKLNICEVGECPDDETTTEGCTGETDPTLAPTSPPSEGECTCPGGYKEGQFLPHPTNCMNFYICTDGVLVEQSCFEGSYYNQQVQVCMPDTENVCPQCNSKRAKRSLDDEEENDVEDDEDIEGSCLDKYSNGELIPMENVCNKYHICLEGILSTHECGTGSYFDAEHHACLRDVNNICNAVDINADSSESVEESLIEAVQVEDLLPKPMQEDNIPEQVEEPNPEPVVEHIPEPVAEHIPEPVVEHIPESVVEHIAVPQPAADSFAACSNPSECTCPGGYESGEILPHPTDCDKYYICSNGQLVLHECGQGYFFQSCTKVCQVDTEHTCWPETPGCGSTPTPAPPGICIGVADGELKPNANQCNAFYQCLNGQAQPETCSTGEWFNPNDNACEVDLNGTCINPCAGITGIKLLPHPDCKKFYLCNDGVPHINTCEFGGFDEQWGVCMLNATCVTLCNGQSDGTTFAVPDDNTTFYYCLGGVAIKRDCEPNTMYTPAIGVCLPIPNSNCNQTMCAGEGILGAFPTLNESPNSFCACRGGVADEFDCPTGYIFDTYLGICYSNAPCDPEGCKGRPDYSVNVNRNYTDSFCLCVASTPISVVCPFNYQFNPYFEQCLPEPTQDANCNPTFCLTQPDYTTTSSITTNNGFCLCNSGSSTFHNCQANATYIPSFGVCMVEVADFFCNATLCANNSLNSFPANDNPSAFCFCESDTTVVLHNCPPTYTFDANLGICLRPFCDSTQCQNPANNAPFPAIDYEFGFCLCNGTTAELKQCEADYQFDAARQICQPAVFIQCNLTLCNDASRPYPYSLPTKSDNYSFCYCVNNTVQYVNCPPNMIFSESLSFCIEDKGGNPGGEGGNTGGCNGSGSACTCPGGYPSGELLPHPKYCSQYYICENGQLILSNCGSGSFFNASLGVCQVDTCNACTDNPAPCSCVGAYREGDMIAHPTNPEIYYVCANTQLHQQSCGVSFYFDIQRQTCMPGSFSIGWGSNWRKRSARTVVQELEPVEPAAPQTEDFHCLNNSKRSVPANCSQYEICLDNSWQRRVCHNHRYYNPEQQQCLEPRDDMVCSYAKVSGLPRCDNFTAQQTLPHKNAVNCGQYYRCVRGNWQLKSCGKQQYYSRQLRTCLSTHSADVCSVRNATDTATRAASLGELSTAECRHLAVRSCAYNCAMYLMCMEGEWWYQYCPLGMYFNRTLNYCMPDVDEACSATGAWVANVKPEPEFAVQNCTRDGMLRPSALACDKYYICAAGKWRQQTCSKSGQYYNVTSEACEDDVDGVCLELSVAPKAGCTEGERREFPLNCTAFEACEEQLWQRYDCDQGYAYDVLLRKCVLNSDGRCAQSGLRKACRIGEMKAENCTSFRHCEDYSWQLATCLKGHTYLAELHTCVPHAANDSCKSIWNMEMNSTSTLLPAGEHFNNKYACLDRADGFAVPHASDCTRFYLCLQEAPTSEQQCDVGSFFDENVGYCRPNDGSCLVPLTGVCENAENDELLPSAADCRAYYHCSTLNGTQLQHCPDGQYFENITRKCHNDHGECYNHVPKHKCADLKAHGRRLAHEHYCNIFYACVRGLAIPVECPEEHQFNPVLEQCLYDDEHQCRNGELIYGNETLYTCGNLTDGTYLPNRKDCTRYFICSEGHAQYKRCPAGSFFDSQELLCIPDDGSCPYVDDDDDDGKNHQPTMPDPTSCEGKHGNMLPDPSNCNEFYVCINGKLRHERCYANFYFNTTSNQCQEYQNETNTGNGTTTTIAPTANATAATMELTELMAQPKCSDKPTNFNDLCAQITEGNSIAEQGDCRRYISCQDNEPTSQRCRNGESFDSLLGFCRQNDGTCLLENGKRVGECNGRHGQLTRDTDNCLGYFVCINGQKISGECGENEYFDRTNSMCLQDTLQLCNNAPKKANTELMTANCKGLSEAVLYPYTHDHCRSYFQCVQGTPRVHECADGLYFDASSTRCIKEITECVMPAASTATQQILQRAPDGAVKNQSQQLCVDVVYGLPYANLEDQCRSYYVCESADSIKFISCPVDTMYSTEKRACAAETHVVCKV